MGSTGSKFRIGDVVESIGTKKFIGVVVGCVSWRDCVLTMSDTDARLFTDQVRSKCGDNFVLYQRLCVQVGSGLMWTDNFMLKVANVERGTIETESEDKAGIGEHSAGQG
jgi:hypothetical protein